MDTTDILAAMLLITFGLPALYFNMLLVLPTFGTMKPFELICASHAMGNLVATTAITFCSVPSIFFNLNNSVISRLSGNLIRYGYYLANYTQLMLAINRFIAIYFIKQYGKIFSIPNTGRILVILMFCLTPYFFVGFFDGCAFYFVSDTLQFAFERSQCGLFFTKYFLFYFSTVIFASASALDLLTAFGMYCYYKNNIMAARRFNHNDVMFFAQCCTSNALLIGCFLLSSYLGAIYQDRLGAFLTSTFIMQVTHFLDGIAVALLNRDIRANVFKPSKLVWSKPIFVQSRLSDVI